MGLNSNEKLEIERIITSCLRNKFKNYKPESNHMPFHHALLGKDRMALFSFIQSLNTTFGTSIFEPVAASLAIKSYKLVKNQYIVGSQISEGRKLKFKIL
jgi:Type II restriction endonuclease, TdeIII